MEVSLRPLVCCWAENMPKKKSGVIKCLHARNFFIFSATSAIFATVAMVSSCKDGHANIRKKKCVLSILMLNNNKIMVYSTVTNPIDKPLTNKLLH